MALIEIKTNNCTKVYSSTAEWIPENIGITTDQFLYVNMISRICLFFLQAYHRIC